MNNTNTLSELYAKSGLTQDKIVKATGVSAATVSKYLKSGYKGRKYKVIEQVLLDAMKEKNNDHKVIEMKDKVDATTYDERSNIEVEQYEEKIRKLEEEVLSLKMDLSKEIKRNIELDAAYKIYKQFFEATIGK